MSQNPLLSIYIPTYNRCKYISQILDFLVKECEEFRDKIEIIVSNNCSKDSTEQIINEREDRNFIQYYCNSKNEGIVGNAYLAKDRANADFLWIIGDDDLFEEGVVARVIKILEGKSDISYVYLNCGMKKGDRVIVKHSSPYKTGYSKYGYRNLLKSYKEIGGDFFFTSAMIIKKDVLIQVEKLAPLSSLSCYAWSFLSALISSKKGISYFEKNVWVYGQPFNSSWKEQAFRSHVQGIPEGLDTLKQAGFKWKEIHELYVLYLNTRFLNIMEEIAVYYETNPSEACLGWRHLFLRAPLIMTGKTISYFLTLLWCRP